MAYKIVKWLGKTAPYSIKVDGVCYYRYQKVKGPENTIPDNFYYSCYHCENDIDPISPSSSSGSASSSSSENVSSSSSLDSSSSSVYHEYVYYTIEGEKTDIIYNYSDSVNICSIDERRMMSIDQYGVINLFSISGNYIIQENMNQITVYDIPGVVIEQNSIWGTGIFKFNEEYILLTIEHYSGSWTDTAIAIVVNISNNFDITFGTPATLASAEIIIASMTSHLTNALVIDENSFLFFYSINNNPANSGWRVVTRSGMNLTVASSFYIPPLDLVGSGYNGKCCLVDNNKVLAVSLKNHPQYFYRYVVYIITVSGTSLTFNKLFDTTASELADFDITSVTHDLNCLIPLDNSNVLITFSKYLPSGTYNSEHIEIYVNINGITGSISYTDQIYLPYNYRMCIFKKLNNQYYTYNIKLNEEGIHPQTKKIIYENSLHTIQKSIENASDIFEGDALSSFSTESLNMLIDVLTPNKIVVSLFGNWTDNLNPSIKCLTFLPSSSDYNYYLNKHTPLKVSDDSASNNNLTNKESIVQGLDNEKFITLKITGDNTILKIFKVQNYEIIEKHSTTILNSLSNIHDAKMEKFNNNYVLVVYRGYENNLLVHKCFIVEITDETISNIGDEITIGPEEVLENEIATINGLDMHIEDIIIANENTVIYAWHSAMNEIYVQTATRDVLTLTINEYYKMPDPVLNTVNAYEKISTNGRIKRITNDEFIIGYCCVKEVDESAIETTQTIYNYATEFQKFSLAGTVITFENLGSPNPSITTQLYDTHGVYINYDISNKRPVLHVLDDTAFMYFISLQHRSALQTHCFKNECGSIYFDSSDLSLENIVFNPDQASRGGDDEEEYKCSLHNSLIPIVGNLYLSHDTTYGPKQIIRLVSFEINDYTGRYELVEVSDTVTVNGTAFNSFTKLSDNSFIMSYISSDKDYLVCISPHYTNSLETI